MSSQGALYRKKYINPKPSTMPQTPNSILNVVSKKNTDFMYVIGGMNFLLSNRSKIKSTKSKSKNKSKPSPSKGGSQISKKSKAKSNFDATQFALEKVRNRLGMTR